MSLNVMRLATIAGLSAAALMQAEPATARPADPFSYTAAFVERTTGKLTVGDDTYRYSQASKSSEHERLDDGQTSCNQLIGWIRLAGSGPLAGTKLQQHISTVVDANGVTRVDTYVSSFCQ